MGNYVGKLDTLYWSPSEIAQLATDLSSWGAEIETNIKAAYTSVDSLGTSGAWTGKLFNDLANLMNDQKGLFQESVRVLAEEIPSNLNSSARADAEASQASFASFTAATVYNDYEVTLTDDDGTGRLTFEEGTVETANSEFLTALTTAQENLNKYQSNFNSLFNEILSTRARAYIRYRSIVEHTVSVCIEKFSEIAQTYADNAKAAQTAIQEADVAAATQADNITNL